MPPKLLLADDSITVQRVIALTFQGEGVDVIAVGDGDQAVETIERERPQIVLADLSMPGRDGYAVAEHVKRSPALAADTRVVLLTGAFEPVEERRSQALGIDGVLSKPFEPQVAISLVRRLLAAAPAVPHAEPVRAAAASASGGVMAQGGGSMAAGGDEPMSPAAGYPFEPQAPAPTTSSIALDDYFRRLDEALATAGLAASPPLAMMQPPVHDTPQVTVPSDHAAPADAETAVVARPVLPRTEPGASETTAEALGEVAAAAAEDDEEPAFVEASPAPVDVVLGETVVGLPASQASDTEPSSTDAAAPAASRADLEEHVPQETPAAGVTLVDAFAALLAAEEGRGDAVASLLTARPVTSEPTAPAAPPVDLDALAEQVARKVLVQLTDARIEAIVSERVLEVAERLVREEIERIKAEAV